MPDNESRLDAELRGEAGRREVPSSHDGPYREVPTGRLTHLLRSFQNFRTLSRSRWWHGRCVFGRREKEIPIVAIVHRSSEQRSDVPGRAATQTAQLLAELSPNSDLAWLVERVSQTDLPWVVIPGTAITAWEGRDPAGWE